MNVAHEISKLQEDLSQMFVGQQRVIEQILVCVLADGHVLLEGVPGLGKTLLVRSLAHLLGLEFSRIQFTPDLMPTDVIGTEVFQPDTATFSLKRGPIFSSILLADEINRTPPKTQSALLEAMEERHATISGIRYELPFPFLVFATQNPLEFEGTYPLPEAQQDRFMMKIILNYQVESDEIEILKRSHMGFNPQKIESSGVNPTLTRESLAELRTAIQSITVEDKVFQYIYSVIASTRNHQDIAVGASPRAGIALLNASKALAAIRNRDFVIPDDVKFLAPPILRHRVKVKPEVEIEGLNVDQILGELLDLQVVPR